MRLAILALLLSTVLTVGFTLCAWSESKQDEPKMTGIFTCGIYAGMSLIFGVICVSSLITENMIFIHNA